MSRHLVYGVHHQLMLSEQPQKLLNASYFSVLRSTQLHKYLCRGRLLF
jgi:hypothetical protein